MTESFDGSRKVRTRTNLTGNACRLKRMRCMRLFVFDLVLQASHFWGEWLLATCARRDGCVRLYIFCKRSQSVSTVDVDSQPVGRVFLPTGSCSHLNNRASESIQRERPFDWRNERGANVSQAGRRKSGDAPSRQACSWVKGRLTARPRACRDDKLTCLAGQRFRLFARYLVSLETRWRCEIDLAD